MNKHADYSLDTRAKRLFTVSDMERMQEIGVIGFDERLELVDGVILKMSPKDITHEVLKQHLTLHFVEHRPKETTLITEAGWKLSEHLYLEPDYLVFPASMPLAEVRGPDPLLVIEIAVSSLGSDLALKGPLYAGLGVREYWVVDAMLRQTHVHLEPTPQGYASVRTYPADVVLTPTFMRGYSIRLSDLPEA